MLCAYSKTKSPPIKADSLFKPGCLFTRLRLGTLDFGAFRVANVSGLLRVRYLNPCDRLGAGDDLRVLSDNAEGVDVSRLSHSCALRFEDCGLVDVVLPGGFAVGVCT